MGVTLLSPKESKSSNNAPRSTRGNINMGGSSYMGPGQLGSTDLIKGVSAFNFVDTDNGSNID